MGWLRRLLGQDGDAPDADREAAKAAEVHEAVAASAAAKVRADRAIADYRRLDELHRIAGARSRQAGERLIDEIEDENER